MIAATSTYGIGTTVPLDYGRAVERVKEALAEEGFGILCEIDVAATMKKKLDVEFRPYVILGACNPPLAYRALTAERDIGLMLPCNVIVYSDDIPGRSVIAAMDPVVALEVTGNASIRPLAEDVKSRLVRALAAVETGALPASDHRAA
jgi:uncharacterized protein (DUF302 family)